MNKDRTWYLVSKKLAGEATTEEIQELEGLLRSDPDMHYALQNITDIWELPARPASEADDAFERHTQRMKAAGLNLDQDKEQPAVSENYSEPFAQSRSPKKWLLAGTIICVLFLAGFSWYALQNKPAQLTQHTTITPEKNEISTRNGSKTKVVLPDGSQVWLNSGSHLTYNKDFGNHLREVQLSGEAFFDVTKDKAHPFIIHTGKIDIRVIGTAFNVKSYPGDRQTETSLVRGKVEIHILSRPDEMITLKPNEKLIVVNEDVVDKNVQEKTEIENNEPIVLLSRLTTRPDDNVIVETAWMDNKLVFNNESFREVAAKMERWYNVQFEFRDSANIESRFTGIFENETISQALAALCITGDFIYSIKGNKIIINDK